MIIIANLVKYHSDVNKIPLRNFNEKEINLFFSLLFKAKKEGTNKIKINFIDLRKISNGDTHSDRFIKALKNLSKKLVTINLEQILPDKKIAIFNIFSEFIIDPINKELEIQIHKRFYYMLNDFLTYTQFELEQLVGLRSSYSKNIFRLLKQWESTNCFSVYLDEFKRVLCIPESYKMCHIDQKVFKPALTELAPLFPNLKLEKIKEGRKIKTLKFTWGNVCMIEKNSSIVEIKVSKQLNLAIERAKRNSYVQKLLTLSNVEKLVNKYSEEQLIKGLNFSYREIQYEIKSLSYLEKTIDTGIENSRKKIVVVEDSVKENLNTSTTSNPNVNNDIKEVKPQIDEELEAFKVELNDIAKEKLTKMNYMFFRPCLKVSKTWEQVQFLIGEYKLK